MADFGQSLLNALDGVCYLTDLEGRVVAVGEPGWTQALQPHGSNAWSGDRVIGRSLFEAMHGAEVPGAYRAIHARVATGERPHVAFEMRCDAPDVRRLLRMSISAVREPGRPPAVLYHSQVLSAVARPWMSLFEPERIVEMVRRDAGLPIVRICSICHLVAQSGEDRPAWVTAEAYYQSGGEADVRVSHGLCPDCTHLLAGRGTPPARAEPARGAASAPAADGGGARLSPVISERALLNQPHAEQLATFFDVSLDLLCIRDMAGQIVKVSPAWESCLGYRRGELEGLAMISLIHPDDVASTRAKMAAVDGAGDFADNFINRYRHKDGSYRHIEWRARRIGAFVYGVGRDISARVEAENQQQILGESLAAERGRLRLAQSVAKIGTWEIDPVTHEVTCSDEMFRILGMTPTAGETSRASLMDVVHPDDRQSVEEAFVRSIGSTEPCSVRHRVRLPGRRIKYIEERWQWLPDGRRGVGTCQDITERHEEMTKGRAKLESVLAATRAILENSHDIVCTVSREGRILQINPRAEEILGYRPEELVGAEFLSIIHPDRRASAAERADEIFRGSRARSLPSQCLTRSGAAIPVMWSANWSRPLGMFFAVARDMREQLSAEDRLRQAQKMEAVGRLTGGVAHDFNNLLTVIMGSAEAVAEASPDRPEVVAQARLALDAADRGPELVARLLAFSRNQPLVPQPLDCNEILNGVREMVRRTFTEDIDVVFEKGPEGLRCLADRTQLTTALLNLCLNARDAMPNGGRLVLRAAYAPGKGVPRKAGASPPNPFVVLTVEDNGSGMSEETREHATEPFFTTKGVGDGSGLGLSMVYGFASQSGGSLQIESALGVGTRVDLCLPATDARVLPEPASDDLPTSLVEARILVVEDDDLIRAQVERQLRVLGHRVTVAANGVEALELLLGNREFDLLMTDVVMPAGMNGRELAERARALAPHMRILLTSGHDEDAFRRGSGGHGGDDFLSKPYRRKDLEVKISRLLA